MPQPQMPPSNSGGDDITKIGALSDGFANTATNSTEIDDGSNGYIGTANGDNRNNYNDSGTHDSNNDNSKVIDSGNVSDSGNTSDSSTNVNVNADIDVAAGNGDNRENSYDWNYTDNTKNITHTDTDNINKTEDSYNSKIEDSYNAKTEDSYNTSTSTKVEDSNNTSTKVEDSYNSDSSSHSFNLDKSDNDFADLDNIKGVDNLGVAGGDLTFNLGDDFSFNLDVNNLLGGDIGGAGFSAVQANHLVDQDVAYNLTMDNGYANNQLSANGGSAWGDEGVSGGHSWSASDLPTAGDDLTGTSTADASAILANSGFHMELVQGANMLSNSVDSTIAGNDVSHVGEDTSGA